jgi:hypothetical protein
MVGIEGLTYRLLGLGQGYMVFGFGSSEYGCRSREYGSNLCDQVLPLKIGKAV